MLVARREFLDAGVVGAGGGAAPGDIGGGWDPKGWAGRGFILDPSGSGASHTGLLPSRRDSVSPWSPARAHCLDQVPGAGSSAGANRPSRSPLRRRKAEAEAGSEAGAGARACGR